jgi:UDP-GlcNAc3NAcA epimerase
VVLPLHPRTSAVLQRINLLDQVKQHINVIEPVGYLDMMMLEKWASFIATDSGGVQKEAFFFEVPCATLRPETEWVELVELGWNHLVRLHDRQSVSQDILAARGRTGKKGHPYGKGDSVQKIVDAVGTMLKERRRFG